ncbi:uncharacterized protein EI97DRAFT_437153 [Westerdykella ornata]|uniref:Uncharacterized protein n=1 Tax=Westerdykella ornata TaxID=318751 RepID=A0A6A6J6X2_WESOR|nr:uncharacterized protein EI97DRAFT_437153 [Westerdykella ornata]KAF2272162.1 hypothetical protein EI97DRAFT_437153 [Westerdykella ornata]
MKHFAITLVLATLALASPAPIAEPEAAPAAAPVAQPEAQRITPEAAIVLEPRVPKKKKGHGGGSEEGNGTDSSAASMFSASRAVQLGAVGLGVVEVVRLWG